MADDNLRISSSPRRLKEFKAHVVMSLLTNSSLMFSDSQVIGSFNLRTLLRTDDTIRSLAQDKHLYFALREQTGSHDGPAGASLAATQAAFEREGKLRVSGPFVDDPFEFDFVERQAGVVRWAYRDVRDTFTATCKKLLFSDRTNQTLGDPCFAALKELVAAQEALDETRDKGLGRAFLQLRLPDALGQRGFRLKKAQKQHLIDCSLAPYLSNLPTLLKRNPIYEPHHASSFELLRGADYRFVDIDSPRRIPTRLDARHFIEGLSRLDADHINGLRDTFEFKRFLQLTSESLERIDRFYELREAFEALNIRIDRQVFELFPDLHASNVVTPREIRSRVAVANRAANVFLDILGLMVQAPFLGTFTNLVIDAVRTRTGLDDQSLTIRDSAQHSLLHRDLERALKRQRKGQELTTSEDFVLTESYPIETIVGA